MSILIKNGRVVTSSDEFVADLFIEEEQVTVIGESLSMDAETMIDASGKFVLPAGVDVHTHMDLPVFGTVTCDDFSSGTISAAFGGVGTIVDFCFQIPGQSFSEALDIWHDKLVNQGPVVDVGFHIAITDLKTNERLDELARLPSQGVTSFKLFMAYKDAIMVDDETLFKSMRIAARTGSLVMVHAENGDAIDILIKEALAEGRTSPRYHAETRPPELEGEATNRAIQLARVAGSPVYIVHVSCAEAIDPIARARAAGWRVWGETCTHYLVLDSEVIERPNFEGAKYVYTPPPRARHNLELLWDALATNVLSIVSSDHAAFNFESQKTLGVDDFSRIPNGAPGIEERLKILYARGVCEERFDMCRLVDLFATAPAKLFGLYPRKGTIAVGSDADIVIFDPTKSTTLSAEKHHSACDYNVFEGLLIRGAPDTVLVRGAIVVDQDELQVSPGHGHFVKRARFGERLSGSD